MSAPWVFEASFDDNLLSDANNWSLNGDPFGADGAPGADDSVDVGGDASGSLTVGTVTGDLRGGTITASMVDGSMIVEGGATLIIKSASTLAAGDQLEDNGGAVTVDDDVTANLGTLWSNGGTITINGDLACTDVSGYDRGNVLMEGGTIDVTGTATFGEHSFISDQFIIDTNGAASLATFEAANLVFGSQTVATTQSGDVVYTGVTFEDLDLAGLLVVNNTLTINTLSSINLDLGYAGASVQIGDKLVDSGSLSAGNGGSITIGQSAQLLGGGLGVDGGATLEIGGTGNTVAGGATIDSGGSVVGSGSLGTQQTNGAKVGTQETAATYSAIVDKGKIEAKNGRLGLFGDVSGAGKIIIDANASLELGGALDRASTVTFADPGQNPQTLIIDNPSYFQSQAYSDGSFDTTIINGTITGLALDDEIILRDTYLANGNAVIAATIGNLNGVQVLQLKEGTDPSHTNALIELPVQGPNGAAIPTTGADDEFFNVTQSGKTTVLTLQQGNPIDLAVNGPAARQTYGVSGAGVTIGVISTGDEGDAMAELINAIAPGVHVVIVDGAAGVGGVSALAGAINALAAQGVNIIVDDLGASPATETVGNVVDQAIDSAVQSGIDYVTAAGNDRKGLGGGAPQPVYGHSADPFALTVAAMNYLATPNPPSQVGGYLPANTEPFSSVGKVDITGPDGGATSQPLLDSYGRLNGLNPFFGTSAAAPAVAAVAALMMQQDPALQKAPLLLDQLLEQSAYPFGEPATLMGAGLVQAGGAVAAAESATTYVINNPSATGPTVKSMLVAPGAGDVDTGATVEIVLTLSEGVTIVGGAPTFTLNDGGVATYDAALSTPLSGKLVFESTVGSTDRAASLELTQFNANGATIQDSNNVAADFLAALNVATGLSVNSPLVVNSVSSAASGEAAAGQTVQLTLTMNEGVTVNTAGGAPTLTLNDGGEATYDAAASNLSAGALVFDYVVGTTDATPDLSVFSVNLPTTTTVRDANGYNADFSADLIDKTLDLQVGPAFVSNFHASQTGSAATGQTVQLNLALSQAVTIDSAAGAPSLTLSDGATATYDAAESNPATGALAFDYVVGSADSAADLAVTAVVNGASISDGHGTAADLSDLVGAATDLSVNSPLTVTSISASQTGELAVGQSVEITIQLNGAATLESSSGDPLSLALNDAGTAIYDAAKSDIATGALVFDYTGGADKGASDLAVTAVDLNDDAVTNAAGFNADFSAALNLGLGLQVDPGPNHFDGGGYDVNLALLVSDTAYLSNTAGVWDNVVGSDGAVYLTSAQAYVSGGGDKITFSAGSGNAVGLSDTGGVWDSVFGADGKVELASARAKLIGGGDTIDATGSGDQVKLFSTGAQFDKVFGADLIAYVVSAEGSFIGGGNSIRTSGSGDRLKLLSTGSNLDKVFGANINASVANAEASFISGGDVIRASGAGDVVKLFATFGVFDKVYGTNLTAYLINAQASFTQGGNTIHLLDGPNDTVKLFATGAKADSVIGSDSTVDVIGAETKITGSRDTIALFDNDTVSLVGGAFHLLFQPAIGKDTINGFNASDTLQFSTQDFASFAALQGHVAQSGANAVISLDAHDILTLTDVTATSLSASQFRFV